MIKFCEIFFSIKVPSILTQASLYFSTIQVSRESRSIKSQYIVIKASEIWIYDFMEKLQFSHGKKVKRSMTF